MAGCKATFMAFCSHKVQVTKETYDECNALAKEHDLERLTVVCQMYRQVQQVPS